MPTVVNETLIPDFLRPLFERQAGVGMGALDSLARLLGGENFGGVPASNLIAGFTPAQQEAFDLAIRRARGEGGFIPTAQNTFLQAAQGQGLDSFIPQSALSALTGLSGSAPSFSPFGNSADVLGQIAGGGNIAGTDVLGQIAGGGFTPSGNDVLRRLATTTGAQIGDATSLLGSAARGSAIDPQTLDVLRQTAGGDFLFGGQGFDQAVDAAVRAAQPHLLSRFGAAGAGGGTGGLAQTAIAQAGIDAFASQFGQERANQLSAANALSQFGLADKGQQLQAAQSLGNLGINLGAQQSGAAQALNQADLATLAQRAGAAQSLGQLDLSGRAQQASAAGALGQLGLNLDQLGLQGRQQQLSAAGVLAGLGNDERSRQIAAAQLLPSLATVDADILSRVGGAQQEQAQRELTAPIDAMLRLLQASGTSGLGQLLGNRQNVPTDRNQLLEGLGLATSLVDLGQGLFGDGGLFGDLFSGGAGASTGLVDTIDSGIADTEAANAQDLANLEQPSLGGGSSALPALGAGAGALGAAGLLGGSAVPAGTVSITEGAALADLMAGGGGFGAGLGGLGGLAAGANAGALSGLGATAAAGEAALLGGAAPTLAPLGGAAAAGSGAAGAGAALGGGASADAAAGLGAAGGASAGLLASLGIAAIPAILAATTPFGDEIHDESSQAARALQGLGMTTIRTAPSDTRNAQNLLQLPNGEFIAWSAGLGRELGNRWGKEPAEATLAWLMSFPRVQYSIPHFAQQSGTPEAAAARQANLPFIGRQRNPNLNIQ